MESSSRELTVQMLAEQLGCPFEGDGDTLVSGVAPLADAGLADLSFLRSEKWAGELKDSQVGALIAPPGVDVEGRPVIRSGNPGLLFGRAVSILIPRSRPEPGVHANAFVDPTATVDPTASIGPNCSVGAGAVIGARSA